MHNEPKIKEELTTVLDLAYKSLYAKSVKKQKFIEWHHEEHIRIGYSYFGLGKLNTLEYLYYPLKKVNRQLLFADEHTTTDLYGFMEGALKSGFRTASQISLLLV